MKQNAPQCGDKHSFTRRFWLNSFLNKCGYGMLPIAIHSNSWFVVLLPSKHTAGKAELWGYANNLLGRIGINIWNKLNVYFDVSFYLTFQMLLTWCKLQRTKQQVNNFPKVINNSWREKKVNHDRGGGLDMWSHYHKIRWTFALNFSKNY